jgi:hypothetical protein
MNPAPSPLTTATDDVRRVLRTGLLFGLLALGVRLTAGQSESIAISATAAPPYVRPVDAQGKPLPETYVLSEGHFLGGGIQDAAESRMKFDDVVRFLAPSLAKQNYFPTKDVPAANLILSIYWGTTLIYEDPQKAFAAEPMNAALKDYNAGVEANGSADSNDLNNALDRQSTAAQSTEGAIARNAALLGYKRALQKEERFTMPTTEEQTMREELAEERYFIVLMAYDYQYMRKEHKPRLLWVTRLSVRSPGNNFTEALPALALAGGNVFGHQLDGLVRVKAPVKTGTVKLGEMEVMGTVENLPPPKKER